MLTPDVLGRLFRGLDVAAVRPGCENLSAGGCEDEYGAALVAEGGGESKSDRCVSRRAGLALDVR